MILFTEEILIQFGVIVVITIGITVSMIVCLNGNCWSRMLAWMRLSSSISTYSSDYYYGSSGEYGAHPSASRAVLPPSVGGYIYLSNEQQPAATRGNTVQGEKAEGNRHLKKRIRERGSRQNVDQEYSAINDAIYRNEVTGRAAQAKIDQESADKAKIGQESAGKENTAQQISDQENTAQQITDRANTAKQIVYQANTAQESENQLNIAQESAHQLNTAQESVDQANSQASSGPGKYCPANCGRGKYCPG